MKEYKTVCPYDCPDACGLIVTVRDNRVVKVRGDADHAFTRGTLCPKMIHYERTIHSPHRLTRPLKRVGPKGSGVENYVPITWDEALSLIVDTFRKTACEFGSESILRYSYAGTMGLVNSAAADFFFRRLGATDQDRGICSPAKQAGYRAVYGETAAVKPQEAQHSDLIILWGINAAATDIHFLHDVRIAKENGARVWVIDTHKTYTAVQGDECVYVQPGTDGALALGMMHVIERDGLADDDFIRRYVQGYDELVKEVLPKFTPEYASSISLVPADLITRLAHEYAKAKAPFIRLGSGLSRYGNGAMTCRCINALPAIVGAWARKGGGLLSSTSTGMFLDKSYMQQPHIEAPPKRLMPMIKLGEMLTNPEGTPVHALYIFSSNPAVTAPNQNAVRRGLLRDDLFTVVHERFFTDTCAYADIILPATTSVEHDDLYSAYGHYTVAAGYKAVEPVGEARSNWQVISELARRMDMSDDIFYMTEKEIISRIVNGSQRIADGDKEKILAGKPVEMTLPDGYKLDFRTPSGKIEILNPKEKEPLIRYRDPYGDEGPFWLINGNDIRILDSSFCEHHLGEAEFGDLRIHPDDAAVYAVEDGDYVEIYNTRGTVRIRARHDATVRRGTLVTLGLWWQSQSSDPQSGINALTSDRPTDVGWGSTFYDVKVHIRHILRENR